MTVLSADRPVVQAIGEKGKYPVKASTTLYDGVMVGETSGYARGLTTADVFVGHAISQYDNSSGSDGDIDCEVLTGQYRLQATVASVAITDIGAAVYASDDATLGLSGSLRVGTVAEYVTTNTAIVEFNTSPVGVTPSDGSVTEAKLASALASGITTGAVATKVIASAQLKALLDTNENNLFAAKDGDLILNVKLVIQAAAGGACAVTIGTDVDVDGTTKDVDSLLKAGDANATGIQSADDVAATYLGADLAFGALLVDDDGNVTISSSTDQSSSSFVGMAIMSYIPAG